jgi:hypothetical protein
MFQYAEIFQVIFQSTALKRLVYVILEFLSFCNLTKVILENQPLPFNLVLILSPLFIHKNKN